MKLQRIQLPDSGAEFSWTVLGYDYFTVRPVEEFLSHLGNIERSPKTVKAYAHHLKLYWEFLQSAQLDWKAIGLRQLADFIAWPRNPQAIEDVQYVMT